MNEDGTPIEGEESNKNGLPAGQSEGAAPEPSAAEIKELYEATGVKAPVPTDKSKKRPSTSTVRTKDDKKNSSRSADDERGRNGDDGGKSKNASDSNKDGDAGDGADSKGKENKSKDGKVSDASEEAGDGVQKDKSRAGDDASKRGEGDSEQGSEGTGQEADDEGAAKTSSEDDEEKRSGKRNPEIEKRIQKLANEKREAIERAEKLEKQLQQTTQKQQEEKIASEDPEYQLTDFKKVRDNKTGEVMELSDEQAELAYRRWKDGYEQRGAERQAEQTRQEGIRKYQEERDAEMMQSSVEAFDTLQDILQSTPGLDVRNEDEFDEEFSNDVMPLIEDSLIYFEGTEPTKENAEKGIKPVIIGMKYNPKKMLEVINKITSRKRSLPLNGTDDNVESRSNVSVPHGSKSSDPTVNQANELMKTLKINKRF